MVYRNAKLYKKTAGRPRKGYSKTGSKLGRPSTKASVAAVKTIVKKAIARNVENKNSEYFNNGKLIYPSVNSLFNDSVFPVTPYFGFVQINQGTTVNARIGNKIKIKNLTIKGTIEPMPYDAIYNNTPRPTQVVMWVFYDKTNPTVIPQPQSDFFKYNASNQAFQNNLTDAWAPINTEKYRVLTKRIFKVGFANATGSGAYPVMENFANNDYKLNCNFRLNLTKYIRKTVTFDENQTTPTTRGLYIVCQAIGSGAFYGSGDRPITMRFWISTSYEDA